MRRALVSALLASAMYAPALSGSAWAGALQIASDGQAANQGAAQPDQAAPAPQSKLGGGFIQMLFGGAAREPTVPRPFQPNPDEQINPQAYHPQAYPRYEPAPAAAQPQRAAAQQAAYQPPADYDKLIPMPQVGYEPLPRQDMPQRDLPQRDLASAETTQSVAPSSRGDMAHPAVDPKFDRQLVDYKTEEKAGTIVIDTPNHFLFLVQEHGKAMRYGIGVGRPGFTWEGVKSVTVKKEWPDWYPPSDMLQRRPDLPRYMAGGPENPLGARAMYLGSTLYRIHGSNEPWTIGGNVSSGCIRLRNADVIDLYNRVQVGTKVVVM
jgi:lipoprotein-anchoring transpeptidase ErfK/SrfK